MPYRKVRGIRHWKIADVFSGAGSLFCKENGYGKNLVAKLSQYLIKFRKENTVC